jgi:hypothetical protein
VTIEAGMQVTRVLCACGHRWGAVHPGVPVERFQCPARVLALIRAAAQH